MPKFSGTRVRPNVSAPVATTGTRVATHEGGIGYERDARSELYLLAVSNLVGEDTIYEAKTARDIRFADLVAEVTRIDPDWVARFVPYLRKTLNLRSCPLVMAASYVAAGGPGGRSVIASALDRADEPAEMLAYWKVHHGRSFPQPVKRGVADAVARLYTQTAALRYDGQGPAWRMGDVIDLVHPRPCAPWQADLFRYLLDRRHNRAAPRLPVETLDVIAADRYLRSVPSDRRREIVRNGGDDAESRMAQIAWRDARWSWERLSGWLPGGMDAEAWEAVIPQMGYMARLRNLRNFDKVGVSDAVAADVARYLADPAEVAKSRQLPVRFLSAHLATTSMRWGLALETALGHSVANVPALPGRTLVLVDVSGSMTDRMSAHSEVMRWQVAATFGIAMAQRNVADLVLYNHQVHAMSSLRGASLLRTLDMVRGYVGGGTATMGAIASTYAGHDRVVVLTDEQAGDAGRPIPDIPAIYTFNLAGYRPGHLPSGEHGRYTFGGLSDACFGLLAALDATRRGFWPF